MKKKKKRINVYDLNWSFKRLGKFIGRLKVVPDRSSASQHCPNQGMLKFNYDAAIGDLSSCIVIVTKDWRVGVCDF